MNKTNVKHAYSIYGVVITGADNDRRVQMPNTLIGALNRMDSSVRIEMFDKMKEKDEAMYNNVMAVINGETSNFLMRTMEEEAIEYCTIAIKEALNIEDDKALFPDVGSSIIFVSSDQEGDKFFENISSTYKRYVYYLGKVHYEKYIDKFIELNKDVLGEGYAKIDESMLRTTAFGNFIKKFIEPKFFANIPVFIEYDNTEENMAMIKKAIKELDYDENIFRFVNKETNKETNFPILTLHNEYDVDDNPVDITDGIQFFVQRVLGCLGYDMFWTRFKPKKKIRKNYTNVGGKISKALQKNKNKWSDSEEKVVEGKVESMEEVVAQDENIEESVEDIEEVSIEGV